MPKRKVEPRAALWPLLVNMLLLGGTVAVFFLLRAELPWLGATTPAIVVVAILFAEWRIATWLAEDEVRKTIRNLLQRWRATWMLVVVLIVASGGILVTAHLRPAHEVSLRLLPYGSTLASYLPKPDSSATGGPTPQLEVTIGDRRYLWRDIAESSNARASAAFTAIARQRDASRLPPLVAELLALHRTSAAAQIAGNAIRDGAFAAVRPALDTCLLIAAAQHIDQRHRERAVALLASNPDDTLNTARALLETRQPKGDLTSPALRRLATALGDEAAGEGRPEEAERLYVYGGSHLDTAAPSRLVDLYLSDGDRAKLVTLATSVERIRVASSQEVNVAAFEYHRAAMAAFGVLGNDPAVPAANATFHAEKAKQYGRIANIESVREIDRLQMKFEKPPPPSTPTPMPAGPSSRACVAIDGIVDATSGQLRVTIGESAVFRPLVGGDQRRSAMKVETSIALCGNILLAANPGSGIHVYDVKERARLDGRTQLLLVEHTGPMALTADRAAVAEGAVIYIASINSATNALGASTQYDIGEPIRTLSFTHSGLRVTTITNREETIDVVP